MAAKDRPLTASDMRRELRVITAEPEVTAKASADREFADFLLSSPMEAEDFDRGVGMSLRAPTSPRGRGRDGATAPSG
jgi:hypothetical protein